MVWYFIGVYIINRTLHGRLKTRNFSSRVEKIFHKWAQRTSEIFFQHEKRNFVSLRGHVISSIYTIFDWKGTPLLPPSIEKLHLFNIPTNKNSC